MHFQGMPLAPRPLAGSALLLGPRLSRFSGPFQSPVGKVTETALIPRLSPALHLHAPPLETCLRSPPDTSPAPLISHTQPLRSSASATRCSAPVTRQQSASCLSAEEDSVHPRTIIKVPEPSRRWSTGTVGLRTGGAVSKRGARSLSFFLSSAPYSQ